LRESGWTQELLEHFAGCNSCGDALFAACLRDQKAAANRVSLPSPDAIWWLATLDRQRRAVQRSNLAVYRAAMITCAMGGAATAALLWTRAPDLLFSAAALVMLMPAVELMRWRWSK